MATAYEIAQTQLGVKEIPGPDSNSKISEYLASTTIGETSDSIAWCSAFRNWCEIKSGHKGTNSAAARSWLLWGQNVAAADLQAGDTVVFARGTDGYSGHVAFIVQPPGLSPFVKCLGGNQNDSVCIEIFSRARVLGYRRAIA